MFLHERECNQCRARERGHDMKCCECHLTLHPINSLADSNMCMIRLLGKHHALSQNQTRPIWFVEDRRPTLELVRRTVELAEDGRPSKEALAKQLGVAPFRAQKMLVAVGHWTPMDASRAMSRMHEADAAMKGMSRMPPSLVLERALAESL